MARKPKQDAEIVQPEVNEEAFTQGTKALNEIALINMQAQDNAIALAQTLGYQGSLEPEMLENGIQESKSRVQQELFETGKRLLLLRELCAHGDFLNSLERLEIHPRAAQKMMQGTLKLSNATTSAHLQNFGKSKLLELVVLDDEEIEELAEGGTVRGYTADEYDKMSIKEMRVALRKTKEEADADKAANDKVLASKSAEITKLQKQLAKQKVAQTDWPTEFQGYIAQSQEAHRAIQNKLGALDIIREDAMKIEAEDGEESALQQAREMLAKELVHIHNSCAELIEAVGLSFDRTLGAFSDERLNAFTVPTE